MLGNLLFDRKLKSLAQGPNLGICYDCCALLVDSGLA